MGSDFTIINHRYKVVDELGVGSQGTVLRVEDLHASEKPLALKLLARAAPADLLRFEFSRLSSISHPGLVCVFDLGVVTHSTQPDKVSLGVTFFTQELVTGEPSDIWAAAIEPAERNAEVARIGVDIARALHALHRNGLLHRDVKPSNILVPPRGPARLIDLGLSRRIDAMDGMTAGTLGYMAPETLDGFAEVRTDLFGLGATMAHLLIGDRPGPGWRAEADSPPEGIDGGLWEVVARLMMARPEDRFDDASQVVIAIGRACGHGVMGESREWDLLDAASDHEEKKTTRTRARAPSLVGRKKELKELLAWLGETAISETESPPLAVICGPVGVGKSRLVKSAAARFQVSVSRQGGSPPAIVEGSIDRISSVLGVSGPENRSEEEFLKALAVRIANRPSPTLLILDDHDTQIPPRLLHWISEAKRLDGIAALVVVETVSRGMMEMARGIEGSLRIDLGPLKPGDEAALVSAISPRAYSEDELKKIRERTGGIPLLTESVLLADSLGSDRGPTAGDSGTEGLPGSLVASGIQAGYGDAARAVVEAMAVIREHCTLEDLGRLSRVPLEDLPMIISLLEGDGFVVRDGRGRPGLLGLVARGVEESMVPERRTLLHREALVLADECTGTTPGRIARHTLALGDMERFVTEAKEAAKVAALRGDLRGATIHLEGILAALPEGAEVERVVVDLAGVYRRTGRYSDALKLIEARCGRPFSEEVGMELGSSLRLSGDPRRATQLLDPLRESSDPERAATAEALMARMTLDAGDPPAALKLLGKVDSMPDATAMRSGKLATAGLIEQAMGRRDEARAHFLAGLEASSDSADTGAKARFQALLAMMSHLDGDWPGALDGYRKALTLADLSGDMHGAATYAVNLAAIHTERAEFEEALETYRDGLSRLRLVGRSDELTVAGANYAQLLLRLGDLRGAQRASQGAIEDASAAGESARALALCVRGDVLVSLGRPAEAISVLEESHELLSRHGGGATLAACRRHLAAASLSDGDLESASSWLACMEEAPTDLEALAIRLELAMAGEGKIDAASGALETALALQHEGDDVDDPGSMAPLSVLVKANLRLGRREAARAAASRLLRAEEGLRAALPALHKDPEGRYAREMKVLFRNEGIVTDVQDTRETPGGWGWERLVRINTRLNSEARTGVLLDLIMDTALEVTGGQRGFLLMAGEDEALKVRSARNMDRARLDEENQGFSRSVAEQAYRTGEPVVTTDAQQDAQFMKAGSIMALGLRYVIAVPLMVRGVATGTIYVDSRAGGRFDRNRLGLLEALADQAAIAITNNRLMTENRRRQRSIQRLNKQLAQKLESRECELTKVRRDLDRKAGDLATRYSYAGIIGGGGKMREVFRLLDRITDTDVPVVISGESGTGKELVAKAIHYNGPRRAMPFVVENCAAIPANLLESTLFGHVKGAFTGAISDREGLFSAADGGTLFLDEIGDMPAEMQAKLLRVLQDGEVRPVGGGKSYRMDVRVLVASNSDLATLVKAGRFREDLFYRLNVVQVHLPPLRERREDIALLTEHFVEKHSRGKKPEITRGALEAMMGYRWPGNVRQLENEIMRAMVLSDAVLGVEHLSPSVCDSAGFTEDDGGDLTMEDHVDRLKRRLISTALERSGKNRSRAAQALGISRYGLQKMMARMGM